MMAARMGALALRHKLPGAYQFRRSLSVINQRHSAASDRSGGRTSTSSKPTNEDDEGPLRFSTSGAASWRARDTFGGGAEEDDVPWYQMPIVLSSTTALLIYFCVLREESDIDERLGGGTAGALSQVPGLERQTLEAYVRHQEMTGGSAEKEKARLLELEAEEEAVGRKR